MQFLCVSFIQAIFEVQESLREELQRDPTDAELAEATSCAAASTSAGPLGTSSSR
jgi:DNA-directed RNA polymerase specialized sigma subunit